MIALAYTALIVVVLLVLCRYGDTIVAAVSEFLREDLRDGRR